MGSSPQNESVILVYDDIRGAIARKSANPIEVWEFTDNRSALEREKFEIESSGFRTNSELWFNVNSDNRQGRIYKFDVSKLK